MFNSLKYVNHNGIEIDLAQGEILVNEGTLRNYAWNYKIQYNRLKKFYKDSGTKKLTIRFYGANALKNANAFYDAVDNDTANEQAGRLYCGKYYLQGFFYAMSDCKQDGNFITVNVGYIAPINWWWYEHSKTPFGYGAGSTVEQQEGLDFPHGYPYDYAPTMNNNSLYNDSYDDIDFLMTIYGDAKSPSIYIDGHLYHLDFNIPKDAYVVIDTIEQTITLTELNGDKTNLFAYRDRSSNIFKKIRQGANPLTWDKGLKFDVQMIEKRSMPKWI